jgi:signal transduction histidine kinase
MVEDAKGVIVSVGGALYRANKDSLTPYTFAGAPPDFTWILNLAPGKDGAFWVASERGIFRVKDGTFQHWSVAEGLPEPSVWTIMEDRDGTVWASGLTSMIRLKDNQIRVIGRKDGLFDGNIYAIVPDDLGNFWIDSGRGIYRVSRQAMNDFADGRIGRVESLAFDGPDSVTTVDKTKSQERVGCKSLDGRIWFPSAKGVVIIDPAHIPTNRVPPSVDLDRVLANGVAVDRTSPAIVPPGKGELEVHFTALSFAAPQRVKIRYQLEGYDKDWIETENRREAFYTNLRPGHYLFRVTAANGDGVWNTNGPSLTIVLQPYFYQTGWFAALVVAGLAGLGVGIYSWRTTALRWRNEQLERRIAERTAELAKSYEELKQAQTVLLETSRLAGIAEMATGVLHNLGNALNSVNTTVSLTTDRLQKSKVTALAKVVQLLEDQHGRLAEFFSADQRGQQLPGYLAQLSGHLLAERTELLRELEALQQNVDHIKEIVAAQQSFVRVSGITETMPASELVEYGLRLSETSLDRHRVTVVREFTPAPAVKVERQKALQILVNLIRNAKEAINEGGRPDKRLVLGVRVSPEGRVQITVKDNGVGIAPENLARVFAFGYTTKKAGHGFGLHSSANAAKEMGGSLVARSEGPGQGATFVLELPPAG